MIVGLDIASTTGVAILFPNGEFISFTMTGDALYQLSLLYDNLSEDAIIIAEGLIDFRFPSAIRKLSSFHGFLTQSLLSLGCEVYLARPTNVRAVLGVKKAKKSAKLELFDALKIHVDDSQCKFTTDHSDAIAMVLAYKKMRLGSDFTVKILHPHKQDYAQILTKDIKFDKF